MVPLFFLEAHTSHVLLFYTGMGCPPDHGSVSLQLKAALNKLTYLVRDSAHSREIEDVSTSHDNVL